MTTPYPKLSIVSTLFKSEPYIPDFCERITRAAQSIFENDFEIILVNDGSPDQSLKRALDLMPNYKNLKIIDLSRNFGHHKAMMTGLMQSRGELVFLLDSDLEEEPEWLTRFHTVLETSNADVVYGVQKSRKGNFFEKFTGSLFYPVYNWATSVPLPKNIVTARLMKRTYVNALVQHLEQEIFMAGLWAITGFQQVGIEVNKLDHSETTYTFSSKVGLLVNSLTSFSKKPLVFIFNLGLLITTFSLFYIIYLFAQKFFFSGVMSGWTSLMASIWFLGGLIILLLGIIGLYLSVIFLEVKQRPYTIIRQIHGPKND